MKFKLKLLSLRELVWIQFVLHVYTPVKKNQVVLKDEETLLFCRHVCHAKYVWKIFEY